VKKRGADLNSTRSISPATHCICKISPAVGAGSVGEEAGMVIVQLEALERDWGVGGGSELDPLDLDRYALYL
jgi:hypothetical protein